MQFARGQTRLRVSHDGKCREDPTLNFKSIKKTSEDGMFTRMVANYESILDRGDLVYANFYIMLVHAMMNVVGFLMNVISYGYAILKMTDEFHEIAERLIGVIERFNRQILRTEVIRRIRERSSYIASPSEVRLFVAAFLGKLYVLVLSISIAWILIGTTYLIFV